MEFVVTELPAVVEACEGILLAPSDAEGADANVDAPIEERAPGIPEVVEFDATGSAAPEEGTLEGTGLLKLNADVCPGEVWVVGKYTMLDDSDADEKDREG